MKTWFLLVSIMVSTNTNKSFKILFCLAEIVFFCSEFFADQNHYWYYVEETFEIKTSLLLVETFILAVENSFFHLLGIPGCENSFSVKWKLIFDHFLFWPMETDFFLVDIVFFYSELCSESIWNSGVVFFWTETLFLLMKINFLATGS